MYTHYKPLKKKKCNLLFSLDNVSFFSQRVLPMILLKSNFLGSLPVYAVVCFSFFTLRIKQTAQN